MSAQALALVILAGLVHAGWNIVAKQVGGDARFAFFVSVCQTIFWAPLAAWLGWRVLPDWGAAAWAIVVVSGVLHVAYFITLLRGYRMADLTVVYPVARGTGPLLSFLLAAWVLGERVTAAGLLGLLGVVAGVLLISGAPRLLRSPATSDTGGRMRQGLWYGVVTGVWIAAYTLVDGYGVKVLAMSPILLEYLATLVRVALLAPVALGDRARTVRLWRGQWRGALVVAVFSPIAYVMVLYAMQSAPLSHVAPAREVSMLFAALLGGRLLGEGDRLARIAGALLIGCGVAALALG